MGEYAMYQGLNPYRFVLYEDGTVVRQSTSDQGDEFFTVHLEPAEQQRLLSDVDSPAFRALDARYDILPEVSDLTSYVVTRWSGGTERWVSVRGELDHCWLGGAPVAFGRVAHTLCNFSHPRERPWAPKLLELYVESARDQATCRWPPEWDLGPNLVPPDPPERPSVHLIAGERLLPIQRFLNACRRSTGTSAVVIQGRSVSIGMTVAMPHEAYDVEDSPAPNPR